MPLSELNLRRTMSLSRMSISELRFGTLQVKSAIEPLQIHTIDKRSAYSSSMIFRGGLRLNQLVNGFRRLETTPMRKLPLSLSVIRVT